MLPVAQIAGNVEMRKQERVLKDIADPSLLRRQRVTLWSAVRSSAMRPRSGRSSPAIRLTTVVLPLPERPKRAVTPGVGDVNAASRSKSPRRRLTSTSSMH